MSKSRFSQSGGVNSNKSSRTLTHIECIPSRCQAIQAFVRKAMEHIDHTPDEATRVELIKTLQAVTEGKVRKCDVGGFACSSVWPDLCGDRARKADEEIGQNQRSTREHRRSGGCAARSRCGVSVTRQNV